MENKFVFWFQQEYVEITHALDSAADQLKNAYNEFLEIVGSPSHNFNQQYAGNREKADALLREYNENFAFQRLCDLHNVGHESLVIIVDDVISGLLKGGRTEESLSLARLLAREKIPINSPTYTRLLAKLNERMQRDDSQRDQKGFLNFVAFMSEHGYEVDRYQQYQILRMASATGDVGLARACFERLASDEESEMTVRDNHYGLLLYAYINEFRGGTVDAHKPEEIIEYFKEAISRGVHLEVGTVRNLIHFAHDSRMVGLVQEFLETLPAGHQRDEHLKYFDNSLVEMYLQMGEVEAAWDIASTSKYRDCRTFIRIKLAEMNIEV